MMPEALPEGQYASGLRMRRDTVARRARAGTCLLLGVAPCWRSRAGRRRGAARCRSWASSAVRWGWSPRRHGRWPSPLGRVWAPARWAALPTSPAGALRGGRRRVPRVLGLWYASRLRVSGDEPHYLLMAQSLWREGDLDLRDNLAREDWRGVHAGPGRRRTTALRAATAGPSPPTARGCPCCWRPSTRAGGRARCVVLAGAGGRRRDGPGSGAPGPARGRGRAGARSGLGRRRSGRRSPSTPSTSTRRCRRRWPRRVARPPARPLPRPRGSPVACGRRPGPRCSPRRCRGCTSRCAAAARLAVIAVVRLRGRARAAFFAVAGACGAAYLAYYHAIFGDRVAAGDLRRPARRGSVGSPVRALAGLLLDRSFGLLPLAPVFLLALAGLAAAWRARACGRRPAGARDGLAARLCLADVVGRPVPAGALPGARDPAARRRRRPARGRGPGRAASRAGASCWPRWASPSALVAVARPGRPAAAEPRRPSDAAVEGPVRGDGRRALPAVAGGAGPPTRIAWRSSGWPSLGVLLALDAAARRVPRVDRLFARHRSAHRASARRRRRGRLLGPRRR